MIVSEFPKLEVNLNERKAEEFLLFSSFKVKIPKHFLKMIQIHVYGFLCSPAQRQMLLPVSTTTICRCLQMRETLCMVSIGDYLFENFLFSAIKSSNKDDI